jgi:exosortase/archaeosortase family protein
VRRAFRSISKRWAGLSPIPRFLLKALSVYGLWHLVYDRWLLPAGHLDAWAARSATSLGELLLSGLGVEAATGGRVLRVADTAGVYVADGCNGIGTVGAFLGFVLGYPGKPRRRLWFLPVGVGLVLLFNAARVAVMAGAQCWPAGFAWAHGPLTAAPFQVLVFMLCVAWARLGGSWS